MQFYVAALGALSPNSRFRSAHDAYVKKNDAGGYGMAILRY